MVSLQGGLLLQVDGIHPKGFPPLYSKWDSLQGGPLLLLQVNEIHLKGLPLSTANGICFRGVPSKANGIRLLGVPPYPGGSLLQVNEIHLKGLPLSTANGIRFKGVPFSKENGIRLKGFPLSNANESRFKGVPFSKANDFSLPGIPPLHSDSVSLQRTLLHLDISTRPVLHLRITPLRDPICGLLLPSIFPSKGDKEADESSLTAQVKAMIIFILKSFPDAQKSPYHPSSRSFEELQTL